MANTSVHLPADLLDRLSREAARRGVSRNRLIVRACEQALETGRGDWPPGYFSDKPYTKGELRELREGFRDWMRGIASGRRSRKRPPL
jgi:hypothetical protein